MSDELKYHTLTELKNLSLDQLRALWELVPTERQRSYRAAYERELKAAQAEGSDERERLVARELIRRYAQAKLVPLGLRWARAPVSVQESARANRGLEPEAPPKATGKPSKVLIAVFGMLILGMFGFMMLRGTSTETDATPTPGMITQTPLALEGEDDIISGGDGGREAFYPVSLQVSASGAPRVWVVQQRSITASEWRYDPNPDTAAFLSGLVVAPVVGIPWSDENAAWFERLGAGAEFRLQMNTGAVLTYTFERRERVRRSDTGIFRQVTPGLMLVLLGETDADGFPTAERTLILARYPVEQELARDGELVSTFALPPLDPSPTPIPTVTPTPLPFEGLHVELIRVTYGNGQITTYLRLYNGGSQTMRITPDDITLTLGYSENPVGAALPAEGMREFELLPGQEAAVTIRAILENERFGLLVIASTWRFAIEF